ncbi:MAG: GNAT family N-acetyltransferase [Frankiaceae bacterium]
MTAADEPQLTEDRSGGRFVARIGGREAGAAHYRRSGERIVLTHTEVDEAYEGRGIGGALARYALDTARAEAKRVVPLCPFIAAYIAQHGEYADLVDRPDRPVAQ